MADFTKEQLEQILAKLNSYGNVACPYCGSKEGLIVNMNPSNIMKLENIKTLIANGFADTIPIVTTYCKCCGYIMQFNLQKVLE